MAKRLTEDDIRRIFREEAEREAEQERALRMWEEKNESYDPEVEKVWARLTPMMVPRRPDGGYDLRAVVAQVIDTYWEVVEEDLNE